MVEYKSAQGREGDSSLLGSMRGGTRNVLAGQLVSQLVSLGALAALYRLLTPDDFGLLGMAVPLVMLPRMLTTLGLSVATVQRARLDDRQLTHVFWLGLKLATATAAWDSG